MESENRWAALAFQSLQALLIKYSQRDFAMMQQPTGVHTMIG
jgi:hypothetical protein